MTLVIPSDALVSGSVKNVKHLQQKLEETYLVAGFNSFEKYVHQIGSYLEVGVEIKKYFRVATTVAMKPPKKIHKCSRHLNNAPGGIHIRGVCCQVCGPGVLEAGPRPRPGMLAIRWVVIGIEHGEIFFQDETVSPIFLNPFQSISTLINQGVETAISGYHSHNSPTEIRRFFGTSKELLLTDGNEGSLSRSFFLHLLATHVFRNHYMVVQNKNLYKSFSYIAQISQILFYLSSRAIWNVPATLLPYYCIASVYCELHIFLIYLLHCGWCSPKCFRCYLK